MKATSKGKQTHLTKIFIVVVSNSASYDWAMMVKFEAASATELTMMAPWGFITLTNIAISIRKAVENILLVVLLCFIYSLHPYNSWRLLAQNRLLLHYC